MVFIIPQKKVLIPRHSEVHERVDSEARNGTKRKYAEKFGLRNSQTNLTKQFVHTSEVVKCFGMEFRVFDSIFCPLNGIPNCFLFRGMVLNGIPRVRFYFCYTEQNSESILSLVLNGIPRVCFYFCYKEQNSESFFSSKEWFGTEFQKFSVPHNSRNSSGTKHLFRLYRLPRNNFLSEIAIFMASLFLTRGFAALQTK
jgi:hypothetical protein